MAKPLQMNGWLSVPWAEFISKTGHTQEVTLGYDSGNSAIYSIRVNWEDRETACEELLGRQDRVDLGGAPPISLLSRVPPKEHPHWRQLRCERIVNIRPVRWTGKTENFGISVSSYDQAIITARFSMPKWNRTLDDLQFTERFGAFAEWERFTIRKVSTKTDQLTHLKGTFKYVDSPIPLTDVTLDLKSTLAFHTLELTWCRIPLDTITSPTSGLLEGLILRLNKLNNAPFLGFAAGTVLYRHYELDPVENPNIDAIQRNLTGETGLMYNVRFLFDVFDPPRGGAGRGWNMAQLPQNQLWYSIVAPDGVTSLLETADLTKLFQLPS